MLMRSPALRGSELEQTMDSDFLPARHLAVKSLLEGERFFLDTGRLAESLGDGGAVASERDEEAWCRSALLKLTSTG